MPYVILREDLIRVAPLWLKWTEGIARVAFVAAVVVVVVVVSLARLRASASQFCVVCVCSDSIRRRCVAAGLERGARDVGLVFSQAGCSRRLIAVRVLCRSQIARRAGCNLLHGADAGSCVGRRDARLRPRVLRTRLQISGLLRVVCCVSFRFVFCFIAFCFADLE